MNIFYFESLETLVKLTAKGVILQMSSAQHETEDYSSIISEQMNSKQ